MLMPEVKLTGFDFVPREYFFITRFRGEAFYRMKSMKYVMKSTLEKIKYSS